MSRADDFEGDIQIVLNGLKQQSAADMFAFAEWLAQSPEPRKHEHVVGLVIMLLHRLGSQAQARAAYPEDPGPPTPLGEPADLPEHLREPP